MKPQHCIAFPPGEMPLGKDPLITTIWKRVSAADAVMILQRGWQDRAGARAEQPGQHCGQEGTAHGDDATSLGGARGENPLEFGAMSWGEQSCKVLGIAQIQSEFTWLPPVGSPDRMKLCCCYFS